MTPPITSAATTATPAPSVAVTMPPKMAPRMIIGMISAQPVSLNVTHTRRRLNRSSTGQSCFSAR